MPRLDTATRLEGHIGELENLLGEFHQSSFGLSLSSTHEAEYRGILLQVSELLREEFGAGSLFPENLVKAANEGTGFDNRPSYAGVQNVLAVLKAASASIERGQGRTIEQNARTVLEALGNQPRSEGQRPGMGASELERATGLSADELNDAVTLLVEAGLAEWLRVLGTAPYQFRSVWITPRGRYELERLTAPQPAPSPDGPSRVPMIKPPTPVGSPYGFTDQDWEFVAQRKSQSEILHVVLGYQFESKFYDSESLRRNLQAMLEAAVEKYNSRPQSLPCVLSFAPLAAGYGEHLFNEIARDIISADVAIFETSDLNANVMLEMGVALTWGLRVLPIKLEGRPKPPSDLSGQTWADYRNEASEFVDPQHGEKLQRLLERAVRKKAAGPQTP